MGDLALAQAGDWRAVNYCRQNAFDLKLARRILPPRVTIAVRAAAACKLSSSYGRARRPHCN
jgi:hypothetical protein